VGPLQASTTAPSGATSGWHTHVTIDAGHDGGQVGYAGTTQVTAELDLADALDLDHALREGAAELKALGSQESLGARRALTLGHLARHQLALDLALDLATATGTATGLTPDTGAAAPTGTVAPPAARALELHLHFKAGLAGGLEIDRHGRLDEGQRLLLLDLVKSWCGDSHTRITLKPVIDLNTELHTPGYEPTDRQREQIMLRDLRVPLVQPPRVALRPRPHHPLRPQRRSRRPTATRPDEHIQPRRPVPAPSPPQDPRPLASQPAHQRSLRVDQPARPHLPARPHRHHPDRERHRIRSRPTRPTLTPPRTPPATTRHKSEPAGPPARPDRLG
jgi:hypothetical protein